MLEIKNLKKSFGKKKVLNGINLEVKKGDVVGIIGPSGCGKSTLLRCINLLEKPDSGKVIFEGDDLCDNTSFHETRRKIGMVFQQFNLFNHMSVLDNIIFAPVKLKIMSRENAIKEAKSLLKEIDLEDLENRYPGELSGGQKQRVAIASVLAFRPNIIIFDEATSMLDPSGVREVLDTIRSLVGSITILSITHNLIEAKDADRVLVLDEGKIVLDGKPEEVFKEKELLKKANLDITNSMKISELIEMSSLDSEKKKIVEDALWELTFQK